MPHTADLALFVDSEQWNMRGDCPGFHSVVQAHKLCLDSSLHPALMVNMIEELDPYLRRKVTKEPMPTSLDAAVALTWEAFRTAGQRHRLCRRSTSRWKCKQWPRLCNLSRWNVMLCAIRQIGSGRYMPFLERDSRKSSQAAHWVNHLSLALQHNLRVEADPHRATFQGFGRLLFCAG